MNKITLVLVAVVATAFAQAVLKKASGFEMKSMTWLYLMGVAAAAYGLSFILYSRILKYYPLNKIYPAMTVGQIILVTLYGLWIGEMIGARHAVGLALGLVSIYLILS